MAEESAGQGAAVAQLSAIGDEDVLSLRATRCRRDGVVAFPPERFGCQKCGAFGEDLEELLIPARGRITAATVVHRHRGPGPKAPFTIASIALDAGPHVNALLQEGAAPEGDVDGRIDRFGDDEFITFGAAEAAR